MQDNQDHENVSEQHERKLDFLQTGQSRQDQGRFLSDRRYTALVRVLRYALPLLAVAIIGLLFSWPYFQAPDSPSEMQDVSGQSIVQNELLKPRFESRDSQNQPYTITAIRAVQNVSDKDVILLEKPMADITLKNGDWIAIEAKTGLYMQENEDLTLQGGVKIFHDQGYEFQMSELYVDIQNSKVWSDTPVQGQGPQGQISAAGMEMQTGDGVLIFNGPARLILNRNIKGL